VNRPITLPAVVLLALLPALAWAAPGADVPTTRPETLLKDVEDLLAKRPNDPGLLNEYGNQLTAAGRLEEAAAQFEKAVKVDPLLAIAWHNLGVVSVGLGKHYAARSAYRKAIEIQPTYAMAHYNLGVLQDLEGSFEDALLSYQRAIELDPSLLDVRRNPQIVSNKKISAVLIKSYLDRGGSAYLPVQSVYPPAAPKKKPTP
jgi:tetratricopeptide (TPR) repeat protein